jgi:hypothetical protein
MKSEATARTAQSGRIEYVGPFSLVPLPDGKNFRRMTYALDRASRAAVLDRLFDPSISSEENEADERQAASCRASSYGLLRTAIGRPFCINYLITDINALISAER